MKNRRLIVLCALGCLAADWKIAEPGWRYEFPRDHHAHPEFKTEWWYFTGNLVDVAGRRFGYQLTFFRQGIIPLAQRVPERSRFVVGDLKFAHFTVTDFSGKQFHFQQKTSRGAFGEAGFDDGERLAWLDAWELSMDDAGAFHLRAEGKEAAVDLRLASRKSPVIHGADGVSQKAAGEGRASHYYSLTRLATEGAVQVNGKSFRTTGDSWFDHEWASNQLSPQQVGWDWLSVQLNDGTELMLYRMRLADGATDPASSGTFVDASGAGRHLPNDALQMTATAFWKNYPIGWSIAVPDMALQLEVRAVLENQELALQPLVYWEGTVEISGTRAGAPITGRGYLELTGYSGPLRELQR